MTTWSAGGEASEMELEGPTSTQDVNGSEALNNTIDTSICTFQVLSTHVKKNKSRLARGSIDQGWVKHLWRKDSKKTPPEPQQKHASISLLEYLRSDLTDW